MSLRLISAGAMEGVWAAAAYRLGTVERPRAERKAEIVVSAPTQLTGRSGTGRGWPAYVVLCSACVPAARPTNSVFGSE